MREKTIEQKFRAAVKAAGGLAVKFTSPGFDGVPDRLALLPDGKMAFVEVKAPGKKPRPCSFPGTGCCGSWDLKCMYWMTSRRSEG
ncbi:hypothetical protein C823_005809 [Eubacterium plexicaudatum ASF492]|nr:hypothetical protein C823_005809 [Eubacterium plexicaudatum ASF492]